jgi:hypothetical protein
LHFFRRIRKWRNPNDPSWCTFKNKSRFCFVFIFGLSLRPIKMSWYALNNPPLVES